MIILIAAERATAEWSPIFGNVTEKSVHTLISFVFRPAKAHCAFAGRLHGGAARYAHHHGVVCARLAIAVKNRDRRRRRSLCRRDRYHEVSDEGSSRAAVPFPSPSSPPSAELLPGEKPLGDAERGGAGGL